MNLLATCNEILGQELLNILKDAFTFLRYAAPVLAVVFIGKDIITATAAGKEDEIKKAQANMIKRLIVLAVIMLLPTLVGIILGLITSSGGGSFDMCGIH